MITLLLICSLFVIHGLVIVLAMCRAAKIGDDAMAEAFRKQDSR